MIALLLLLILILILSLAFLVRNNERLQKPKDSSDKKWLQLPPGPRGLPLIGSLHQLSPHAPHLSLDRLASIHGPIMYLRLGSVRTLVISSADAARETFKGTNDRALSWRPSLYASSILFYDCQDIVFAPYGDTWRRARMSCVADLLSPRRVQSFRGIREEEVVAALERVTHASSRGTAVDFSELVLRHVNDVICRVAFGRKFKGRLRELLTESQALLGGFCLSDYFPGLQWVEALTGIKRRVWKNFQELDAFYDDVIQSHIQALSSSAQEEVEDAMNASKADDLVTQLLLHQADSADRGAFNCMESIKGVLTDIFIAGTDTSSATLVWTMVELIKNPKVMKRAQDEVRSIIDSTKTIIDETTIPKLNYLKLVIKESLRIHPPTPLLVPREVKEAITIANYNIPPCTRVIINARSIGRDQSYWEDPEEFKPERFFVKDQYVDFKGQHFQLIPFGVGRRICPGIHFSLASVEIILANLLYWFDWKLPSTVGELDMEEAPGITMHKKTPLLLEAKKWRR